MKNTNHEFPDELITCLLHKPWSELTDMERNEVAKYFTPSEYEILHQSMQQKQVDMHTPKEKLMQAFAQHHKTSSFTMSQTWKAVALVLLFGVAALQLFILTQHKTTELVTQIIRDTIVVPQQVNAQPVHHYDTVYLTETKNNKVTEHKTSEFKHSATNHVNSKVAVTMPDVYVAPIEAINETQNQRRRNSIKTDSAFQYLSFVTL